MTSDAKVGLLLGLVFIFIIAFIINGLPRFHTDTNNNELTTNMVNSPDDSMGIAAKERKAQGVFNRAQRVKRERVNEAQTSSDDQEKIRYQVPLSGDDSDVEAANDNVKPAVPASDTNNKTRANKPKLVKPDWPKTYVVAKGDNLAVIAQKFYGQDEGNKRVNVKRIFDANRKQLKSPDDIPAGQKLTIPSLDEKPGGIFSRKLFEKVKSVGRKNSSANPPKASRNKQYVVRDGDSLWEIAARQLGDSERFREIIKLNSHILEDEDYLTVGLSLKMPVR